MAERRTGRRAGSAPRRGRKKDPADDDEREPADDDEPEPADDDEREPADDERESADDDEFEPADDDERESADDDERRADGRRSRRTDRGLTAGAAARAALRQIAELTAKKPEGITGVEPAENGWVVGIEVVEDRRIPSSSDILATYETTVDADGQLLSYRRVRRYPRGRGDSDGGS